MSNGLHQQLEALRRQIAADEAIIDSHDNLQVKFDARQRLPRLRSEGERLAAHLSFGEEGLRLIEQGLGLLRNLDAARELNLGINAAEVAVFRLKNHLGEAPKP